MKFEEYLLQRQGRINGVLEKLLPLATEAPTNLHSAMRYAVLNGGKRLRPILIYLVGETFGVELEQLDTAAAAIEFIHSASLVHDDLPAMDNDTLRRGKPTCHVAFDEATAILVGDALILFAFAVISNEQKLTATINNKITGILAQASGSRGMTGGQDMDIVALESPLSASDTEIMYKLKTGALIRASVAMAAAVAKINDATTVRLLDKFAENIGLAFQIQDDILDIESTAAKLGKNAQSDRRKGKLTYPEIVGLDDAKLEVARLWQEAHAALEQLKINTDLLKSFAAYVMQRDF